ncbi:MAG: TonB family protein [Bacteroidota bacterium]
MSRYNFSQVPGLRLASLLGIGLIWLVGCAQDSTTLQDEILTEVDQAPKPINLIEVKKTIGYPKAARDQQLQGQVVARVLVDQNGQYVEHNWVQEEPAMLAQAVEKELSSLRFEPAQHEGKAVKFWVNIPFTFRLLSDQSDLVINVEGKPKPVNLKEVYEQIRYPESLKKAGQEGKVIARLKVGTDGKVLASEIEGNNPEFGAAVEPFLSQLRYEFPEGEEAKETWVTLPFIFKIPAED